MTTRGIGWRDAALAVAAMVLMLTTTLYVVDVDAPVTTVVVLEATLGALVLALRQLAISRWTRLDWMLCRPELGVRAAT
jgi:hypothetical protein